LGLKPDKVLSMEVNLFGMDKFRVRRATNQWTAKPAISEFYTNTLERLALLPGVESVATTSNLPPNIPRPAGCIQDYPKTDSRRQRETEDCISRGQSRLFPDHADSFAQRTCIHRVR